VATLLINESLPLAQGEPVSPKLITAKAGDDGTLLNAWMMPPANYFLKNL
jgi:hypothetical protein